MSFYDRLNIPKNAKQSSIKKQYQKLAFDYHPDRNFGNNEEFIKIKKAYDILNCKYKRSFYDNFGEEGLTFLSNNIAEIIYIRVFTLLALKLLLLSVFFFILGFTFTPIFLCMKNFECFLTKFTICFLPFYISSIFLEIYSFKCYFLLRKYREKEIRIFLKFLIISSFKFLLATIQLFLVMLNLDNLLKIKSIYYYMPLNLIFILNIVDKYLKFRMLNRKEKNVKQLFIYIIEIFYVFVYFLIINLEFPLKYKFLVLVLIVGVFNFISISSKSLFYFFTGLSTLFLMACYAALTQCIYLIGLIFLVMAFCVFVFLFFMFKSWITIIPKSNFNLLKCLEFHLSV